MTTPLIGLWIFGLKCFPFSEIRLFRDIEASDDVVEEEVGGRKRSVDKC